MKYAALAALFVVTLLPSVASADRYDRGDRYRGHRSGHSYRHHDRHHDHGRSNFSFSFGFGSSGYRDYSYGRIGYGRGYSYRPSHYYSRPPVVYRETYYRPAPRVYYYEDYSPRVYYRDYYCR